MAQENKFPKPPLPSLPREMPWREIEELIDVLKGVSSKLDFLIRNTASRAIQTSVPSNGNVDNLISKLDDFISRIGEQATSSLPFGVVSTLDEISKSTQNFPGWAHGIKDVTEAGSAEQLPDVRIPNGINLIVRAKPRNTDSIYLGNSKTNASRAVTRIELSAGEAAKLKIKNANLVYTDSVVSGEGVEYFVEQD